MLNSGTPQFLVGRHFGFPSKQTQNRVPAIDFGGPCSFRPPTCFLGPSTWWVGKTSRGTRFPPSSDPKKLQPRPGANFSAVSSFALPSDEPSQVRPGHRISRQQTKVGLVPKKRKALVEGCLQKHCVTRESKSGQADFLTGPNVSVEGPW